MRNKFRHAKRIWQYVFPCKILDAIELLKQQLKEANEQISILKKVQCEHEVTLHEIVELRAQNLLLTSKTLQPTLPNPACSILYSLITTLNSLFECKITFSTIHTPIILNSGVTVDERIFSQLQRDPFDRTKSWDQKITNLFAKDVRRALAAAERQMKKEEVGGEQECGRCERLQKGVKEAREEVDLLRFEIGRLENVCRRVNGQKEGRRWGNGEVEEVVVGLKKERREPKRYVPINEDLRW